jgi:hypothetical protein
MARSGRQDNHASESGKRARKATENTDTKLQRLKTDSALLKSSTSRTRVDHVGEREAVRQVSKYAAEADVNRVEVINPAGSR